MLHKYDCIASLMDAGISHADAVQLRRISMTLHRWHELECGNGNDYASFCLVRGYETNKPGYWHKFNPWADSVVYVPLVELAQCVAGGTINDQGTVKPHDAKFILARWRKFGNGKLDGYILPQPSGDHSIGVRYGSKGEMYLSPHNANPDKTNDLLARYRDWKPERGFMYDDEGTPFLEVHSHKDTKAKYEPVPDRERGALKRLAAIMARYPGFISYVQGDPRGCALYILHPNAVAGADAFSTDPAKRQEWLSCNYTRGIAVYK